MTMRITIEDTEDGSVLTGEATSGYLLLTLGEYEISSLSQYGNGTRQFTVKPREGETHEVLVRTSIDLDHRPGNASEEGT